MSRENRKSGRKTKEKESGWDSHVPQLGKWLSDREYSKFVDYTVTF